jgi:homoserine dehydrogenase
VNLYYEASVCGGIPIIKSLREGFVANQFPAIYGIVNGTCNYILSRMKQEGADFAAVLADAQRHGYAETPPDLDIDGCDAQHKIGILASLAHGFWVDHHQIHTEGIRHVSRLDMELLGIVKQICDTRFTIDEPKSRSARKSKIVNRKSEVQVSVYPTLIPNTHVLASVNGVFNACFVRGDVVGDTLFYGRGAGKDATASAVLSDVADAALDLKNGAKNRLPPFVAHAKKGRVMPLDEVTSQYYVRFSVVDKPGVLAKIAAVFAAARIGISSVIQPEGHEGESVPLIFMIHDAPNAAMRKALAKIAKLPIVKAKPVMFRVESLQ